MRLEVGDAQRLLGLQTPPVMSITNKQQVGYLQDVTENWRDMTRTGHLNKYDAWMALNTHIIKMIKYPLPALTLNKKQCKYLMSPIMSGSLNSTRVVCTFPHVVAYAPLKYQGIMVKDPYMTMGIMHIKMLMEECPRQPDGGKAENISQGNEGGGGS
jgi:hypothetical protein